jgi:hypothetical protein
MLTHQDGSTAPGMSFFFGAQPPRQPCAQYLRTTLLGNEITQVQPDHEY